VNTRKVKIKSRKDDLANSYVEGSSVSNLEITNNAKIKDGPASEMDNNALSDDDFPMMEKSVKQNQSIDEDKTLKYEDAEDNKSTEELLQKCQEEFDSKLQTSNQMSHSSKTMSEEAPK